MLCIYYVPISVVVMEGKEKHRGREREWDGGGEILIQQCSSKAIQCQTIITSENNDQNSVSENYVIMRDSLRK